jgi:hypothetical protein
MNCSFVELIVDQEEDWKLVAITQNTEVRTSKPIINTLHDVQHSLGNVTKSPRNKIITHVSTDSREEPIVREKSKPIITTSESNTELSIPTMKISARSTRRR